MIGIPFVRYDHRRHLEPLFRYMTDAEEEVWFLSRCESNSLRDFDGWIQDRLRHFYHDFFVIEAADGGFIGIVYSYDFHMRDGHCKAAVYIAPEWRRGGMGAIAGIQFIRHLLRFYPLRRIHCDVYAYNEKSLTSLRQCGFEQTGVVKEYRYFNGKYHDLVLLSVSRDDFLNKCGQFDMEEP